MASTTLGSGSSSTPWDLPRDDLEDGIERARDDLATLAGSKILITGGTGFLGSWLVASLLWAADRLDLGIHLDVLTRNPTGLHFPASPGVTVIRGDVRSLPDVGPYDYIVHCAAASSAARGRLEVEPMHVAETIVDGTRSVLEVAARNSARVLFLSSGAVYGPQTGPVAEDCLLSPDPMDPASTYGHAKRLAENLCAVSDSHGWRRHGRRTTLCVCRAQNSDGCSFTAGNFLGDAAAGRPIVVRGDGLPRRSYLYTGDLPEWCWALLVRGRSGAAYNVGSPDPVTVEELACRTAELSPQPLEVRVLGEPSDQIPPWYVPSTRLAQVELGLKPRTSLSLALRKTYDWLASRPKR